MAQLQDFKCPCCGGKIEFDTASQQMKCPYCDTLFDVAALRQEEEEKQAADAATDEMDWEEQAGAQWKEGETEGLLVYICNSCGGEIVGDTNTGATSCPFCGNPVVIRGQFEGNLKPDYVIPFQIDKKSAKNALKQFLKGKRLLPKVFKDENHLEEIKGIYVPFWLFDADAHADMRFRATRMRVWSDAKYRYTETSVFSVRRAGQLGFDRVPVDGSSKIANELMESIEPFDFSKAVDFETAYLSGFLADKYDVSAEESVARANERIQASTKTSFSDTVKGYNSVIPESCHIRLSGGKAKYALYPVWLLTTSWKGNSYLFAMNGQTGKFVGNLPLDKGAFMKYFGIWTAALSAVSYALIWLFSFL